MEIIFGIIFGIIAIGLLIFVVVFVLGLILGLIGLVFSIVVWLLKKIHYILAIGITIYIYNQFGVTALLIPIVFITCMLIIGKYRKTKLLANVRNYFYELEMSSKSDLISYLRNKQRFSENELNKVLDFFKEKGLLLEMEFKESLNNPIFRWNEDRYYPRGVIKNTITL